MRYRIQLAGAAALAVHASWALAADLAGTVRDARGQPRAGVTVELRRGDSQAQGPERTATTTAAGEFSFSGIQPGTYTLTCDGARVPEVRVRPGLNRRDCP
jgi:protocatechuate 3,4-dioxygenase beta subunit